MSLAEVVAMGIGGVACLTDLMHRRIPNVLTFGAVAAALAFHALLPQGHGLGSAALGALVGLALFFPVFALGAMGAGDVKLMAALGAWLGAAVVVWVALYGAVAGGVLAVIVALGHGYLGRAFRNLRTLFVHWWLTGVRPLPELTLDAGTTLRLPYAVPIMTGLLVTLWRA